jgi:hypothetical protein
MTNRYHTINNFDTCLQRSITGERTIIEGALVSKSLLKINNLEFHFVYQKNKYHTHEL